MTTSRVLAGSWILVPLDGSAVAAAALPYARALAVALHCSLRLLTVVRDPLESVQSNRRSERDVDRIHSGAPEQLALAATSLHAQGVLATTALASGKPAEVILAQANAADVSLIVMATHGRGGFERWFIGSVADKVMRLSQRPVLLAPSSPDLAAPQNVSLHRILVPLDGSERAESAVPLAATLAQAAGAALLLAQMPAIPTTLMPVDVDYLEEFDDKDLRRAAQTYLDQVQNRLPDSIHMETALLRGIMPAAAIAGYVKAQAIDLVVMSTRGRSGFSRLVLGSTADRLVRMGVPVLLIRPGRGADCSGSEGAAPQQGTTKPS